MTTSDSTPTSDRTRPSALVSVRVITADVPALVAFYETVTGVSATWSTPTFAEIVTTAGTLAIGDTSTVAVFAPGSAEPASNRSAIVEFLVDDVDAEHRRLTAAGVEFLADPKTMPWGNRSLLLRDPDGTLVNLFTPVTPAARAKFGR